MDVDLVVVLSLFDLEEWFFENEVYQVGHVEKNYQNQLDYGVGEGYYQENSSNEFMQIAYERERKLPGSYFGLYCVGEDQQLVDFRLPGIGKVELIFIVKEVVIFILDQYCLLEQDEVVGFLQHQVGHRIVFGDGSQAVDGVADDDQEEDHEDVCVEDGEYLDG